VPVHLECSTRANILARILQGMGYRTRTLAIYDTSKNLQAHTLLDVLNPETGKWESQDPFYDVHWKSASGRTRISLADSAEALDLIIPCTSKECGWHYVSGEGQAIRKMSRLLDIIAITDKSRDVRFAVFTKRADLKRVYSKGSRQGRFCEILRKRCRDGFYNISTVKSVASGLLQ